MLSVGSRYFDVIGVPLLRGRAFTNEDGGPGRQIAIVNQRLVDQYFKGEDPIGRTIRLSQDVTGGTEKPEWLTVVGLVPNVRQRNNNQEAEPDAIAYITHRQNTGMARSANVLARTRSDPAQATQDPARGDDGRSIRIRRWLLRGRWTSRLRRTVGCCACSRQCFRYLPSSRSCWRRSGLYAVTAYAVTQHTRDIGVRMVLGAQPGQVIWLFLKRSIIQLAIGLTIGVAAAFGLGQVLQSFLVQTSSRDPLTLIAIVVLLTVVAFAASVGPARRATRLDPLHAMRHE